MTYPQRLFIVWCGRRVDIVTTKELDARLALRFGATVAEYRLERKLSALKGRAMAKKKKKGKKKKKMVVRY